jgi:hypothetical protein
MPSCETSQGPIYYTERIVDLGIDEFFSHHVTVVQYSTYPVIDERRRRGQEFEAPALNYQHFAASKEVPLNLLLHAFSLVLAPCVASDRSYCVCYVRTDVNQQWRQKGVHVALSLVILTSE